jgi:hypothetical protein
MQIFVVVLLLAFPLSSFGQEMWTLDTPETQGPDRTTWDIKRFQLTFRDGPNDDVNEVRVYLEDNNGAGLLCVYGGDNTSTAHDDIVALNKVNLSATSLRTRILNRLAGVGGTDERQADGGPCLPAGSPTGGPL